MAETVTALTEQLFSLLQKEKFVLLTTVDAETGSPSISAISWMYAINVTKLRFAIDQRSRIIENVKQNPLVAIAFFGTGTVHSVYGKAIISAETLDEVPFKLTSIDIEISAVRDAMFYGSRISVEPEYEKTYDKRAAEKLDGQVFEAMRKA